jgi:hypothetical protein
MHTGTDAVKRPNERDENESGKQELGTIDIHEKILLLRNEIELKFIKLGGYLKLVNDRKLYIEKGCLTFNEYLAMPELGFQRSTAYAIMGVYQDYIEDKGFRGSDISGISYYKLDRIRQFIKESKEKFSEWMSKARELSLSDLNAEIRIAKGESESVVNEGIYVQEKKVYQVTCPKCGHQFEHII